MVTVHVDSSSPHSQCVDPGHRCSNEWHWQRLHEGMSHKQRVSSAEFFCNSLSCSWWQGVPYLRIS